MPPRPLLPGCIIALDCPVSVSSISSSLMSGRLTLPGGGRELLKVEAVFFTGWQQIWHIEEGKEND
jgi:hypothetical protein